MDIERVAGNARMSSAVRHNGTLYLKGVTPQDGGGDITAQTADVLEQIDTILSGCGSSREKVLRVMIWLTDMSDFAAMNAVYDKWLLAGHEPVRACVEARLARVEFRIEIQVVAAG